MDAKTERRIRHVIRGLHEVALSSHPMPAAGEVIVALNRAERGEMPDDVMQLFIAFMLDVALTKDVPISLKIAHTIAERIRGSALRVTTAGYDFGTLSQRWKDAEERHKLGDLAKQSGRVLFQTSGDGVIAEDEAAKTSRHFTDPDELHRFLLSRPVSPSGTVAKTEGKGEKP